MLLFFLFGERRNVEDERTPRPPNLPPFAVTPPGSRHEQEQRKRTRLIHPAPFLKLLLPHQPLLRQLEFSFSSPVWQPRRPLRNGRVLSFPSFPSLGFLLALGDDVLHEQGREGEHNGREA